MQGLICVVCIYALLFIWIGAGRGAAGLKRARWKMLLRKAIAWSRLEAAK
jgi:hypothetical protein